MKKIVIILIVIFAGCSAAPESLFLWNYADENTDVYILGTIHLVDDGFFPLNEKIYSALDKCDTIVLEADILGDMTGMQSLVIQKGMMPESTSYQDFLNEKEFEKLSKACSSLGVPPMLLEKFTPGMIQLYLINAATSKAGLSETGIDVHLYEKAKKEGKVFHFLETIEFQINLLLSDPLDIQFEDLMASIEEISSYKKEILQLVKAYKTGNESMLEKLLNNEFDSPDERIQAEYKRFLIDRNIDWSIQIEEMIEFGGTYFIAVGAGHLLGKENVITQMAKKRYQFSPVTLE